MPEPGRAAKFSQTLTCHLIVKGAARAIDFYARAFGAVELIRLTEPGGKVGHAELRIGDSRLMLADEYPDFGAFSPVSIGGSPVKLHIAVADAEAALKRAVAAGATVLRPVSDEFYGDRTCAVADPFGFSWFLVQHIEDVSTQELQRRFSAVLQQVKA